jgi:hypothetical protein
MIAPMPRFACLIAALLVAATASGAQAQAENQQPVATQPEAPPPAQLPPPPTAPAPVAVDVTTLAAPDGFTTPGRDTGLPQTLWRGASLKTMQIVLPMLAAKPLSPAAAALARRVLATGAPGPNTHGDDATLAGARASALLVQGDPKAAATILARAPGIDRSPDLAQAAAESALLAGDDTRACAVADGLSSGRGDAYWLRLRAYCQVLAGQTDQAQLTFQLAQTQARDPIYGRLMGAKLAGAGDPGAASLRNGLDYALSRSLGLDLSTAKPAPAPAVAAAMSAADPAPPSFDPAAAPQDVAPLAELLARGDPIPDAMFKAMIDLASSTDPKARARGQAATLLVAGLKAPFNAETRGIIAEIALPEGKAPVGRDLALDAAAGQKLMGEAALLALWTSAEAGTAGPAPGDRVRIVHALHAVGLDADARAFALEGLLALK